MVKQIEIKIHTNIQPIRQFVLPKVKIKDGVTHEYGDDLIRFSPIIKMATSWRQFVL